MTFFRFLTLISLVFGVPWLTLKTTLDDHTQFLVRGLGDRDLLEAGGKGVMLDGDLHVISLTQQG